MFGCAKRVEEGRMDVALSHDPSSPHSIVTIICGPTRERTFVFKLETYISISIQQLLFFATRLLLRAGFRGVWPRVSSPECQYASALLHHTMLVPIVALCPNSGTGSSFWLCIRPAKCNTRILKWICLVVLVIELSVYKT